MKIKSTVIAILAATLLMAGCQSANNISNSQASPKSIGVDAATDKALEHSNVDKANATVKKVQIDENGKKYTVVFEKNGQIYNYDIDAETGEVLSFYQTDKDMPENKSENIKPIEEQSATSPQNQKDIPLNESTAAVNTPKESSETPTAGNITLEKAKQIALDHAGLKTEDVTFVKAKIDYDNRKQEYEIEFYSGNVEYDYDIDAATGKITGYDQEIEQFSPSVSGTGKNITIDDAKTIALAKVPGATEKNLKIKQDNDNGIIVYEGEIIYEKTEYEFEISSTDGAIIEWKVESVNR